MVRIKNILISSVLVVVLAAAAYAAVDPAEITNKKRDADLKTYSTRLTLAPKKYLDQLYFVEDKVCYSPASKYVREGSCNQGDVYSLSVSTNKLKTLSCGIDAIWPAGGDPWVVCVQNQAKK